MDDNAWVMYLINLASFDNLARPPAIRSLYYAGAEVDFIAEAADIPVELVPEAILPNP